MPSAIAIDIDKHFKINHFLNYDSLCVACIDYHVAYIMMVWWLGAPVSALYVYKHIQYTFVY